LIAGSKTQAATRLPASFLGLTENTTGCHDHQTAKNNFFHKDFLFD
jgi:hypothetical protein